MTDPLSSDPVIATTPPASSPDDFLARYAEHAARQAAVRPANKAILFDTLAGAGITLVNVMFDGSGDSGQIEEIAARAGDSLTELPTGEIEILSAKWGEPEPERRTLSVSAAVEGLAYDFLGEVASGWENNDGAYGEFTFDVAARTITLDYNERRMDCDYSQFEF